MSEITEKDKAQAKAVAIDCLAKVMAKKLQHELNCQDYLDHDDAPEVVAAFMGEYQEFLEGEVRRSQARTDIAQERLNRFNYDIIRDGGY